MERRIPLGFLILFGLLAAKALAQSTDNGDRIACYPLVDSQLNSTFCASKGCVWDELAAKVKCYLPLDGSQSYGYQLASIPVRTRTSFKVDLTRRAAAPSLYGGDWDFVTFEAVFYSDTMLRFSFYKTGTDVAENQPPVPLNLPTPNASNDPGYIFNLASDTVGSPFDLRISRRSNGVMLLDTKLGGLTLADQFNMITFALPSSYLYGVGENPHDSFAHDLNYRMWPIWARDQPPGDGEMNLYGSHPFYMVSEDDGSSHGVFFFNSHAIDMTTLPYPGVTYRTIGGGLDFFLFTGPEPETVVKQYTEVIGRTMMPPYWALGFQLSRYGYTSTDEIRDVINRTKAAGVPQDVQYADIDHMDEFADFTLGENFTDLPDLVRESLAQGLRFIPILDPAINTEKGPDYTTHTNAMNSKVYITWYNDTLQPSKDCTASPGDCQPLDNVMLGYVWPNGRTGFPDFFKQETAQWWRNELQIFYDLMPWSGIWIDMNEPAAFDTNLDKPFNWPPDKAPWNLKCPVNQWDDPPYITLSASRSQTKRLSDKTICMVGRQGQNDEYLHYAVHNLYGWSQSVVTYEGVESVTGKRSAVITRSTFPSSGQYAGHWLGDNTARWKDMHTSIIGMMEFNMFGINYIGADICGFFVDSTEELCARWMELGAFYPFSRNHNTIGTAPQDPAIWPSVADASRKALNVRYRLLPYLYTLFYDSHTTGSTIVRPLYHEYPTDLRARVIDRQFLWGPALLITPVLDQGQTTVAAYFPDDIWYDYYTGAQVTIVGSNVTLDAPLDVINLHLRGGYILPAQHPALNTALSRENNFELLVALKSGRASGKLFWDDGEGINTLASGQYQMNTFDFNNNVLTLTSEKGSLSWPGVRPVLDNIQVMGVPARPTRILINGVPVNSGDFTYVDATKRLTLACNVDMNVNNVIEFQ